ncbi:MAG: 2-isopropylmalate synthase [Oscillospiraceae bacterium]|nr:2-isopropylmalate synthase [Oscillospiraceae bacterium]
MKAFLFAPEGQRTRKEQEYADMAYIKIFDTTLRDGEQSPGFSMNIHEKTEFARQLERLGVDVIEAGFPVASPEDFASVKEIASAVREARVAGLARCAEKDIRRAWEALQDAVHPVIHVFIATSDIHMEYKLNMTREQVLQKIRDSVTLAKSLGAEVEFSAEDASRSDREFLLQAFDAAVECGASTINIPDTVGYALPQEMKELVALVRGHFPDPSITISVHCHDDLGLSVANSVASVLGGATQVECTVNGIGERAGNAALEEVVMALVTRGQDTGADCGIHTRQIYRTSRLLSTITGVPVPPNKAVVGVNAFAHESGIHQHGVMKNRLTYEIMSPESVGIYQNKMILGKHSGRHAFEERLDELGYKVSAKDLDAAFEKFKVLADRKKVITDRDIEALVDSGSYQLEETYQLDSFVVNSGTVISATAVVKLKSPDGEKEHVARGTGPIDAAFKAIDRIVKKGYPLENYTIQSVTEGEDALGEVVVRLNKDGESITGRGLSTDIIEASIRAYLNAVNKAIMMD